MRELNPSFCKLVGLPIALLILLSTAHAQLLNSARPPGDITLFGDPDCAFWLRVAPRAKQVWLQAILSPINMGYMQREKPATDKFAALTSLAPAAHFVDGYCEVHQKAKAMQGAVKFFDALMSSR
jgi:hypothetical protein